MRLKLPITLVAVAYLNVATSFNFVNIERASRRSIHLQSRHDDDAVYHDDASQALSCRRSALGILATGTVSLIPFSQQQSAIAAEAPSYLQEYDDFTKSDEGWSFRDVKVGEGESPSWGDRVVFDWSGYTIGYFGRPFEAKGGPQGGAFDKDIDYARTVLGSNQIVKGLECAMTSMKPGGIRQVLVPYGQLGYPADDLPHDVVGPKPSTFSGQRALNFVLENPRVDRTLLFNVKLIRVDKPDGKGGFRRGDKR